MHRIKQIKAHLKHRRSKSDSQLEDWSIGCLQGEFDDEDDNEPFGEPSEAPAVPTGSGDVAQLPIGEPLEASKKSGSSSSLPFVSGLRGSFRRKLGSNGSPRLQRRDVDRLTPSEPTSDFIYDNDGLRARPNAPPTAPQEASLSQDPPEPEPEQPSVPLDPLAAATAQLDAFDAPAWVTFGEDPSSVEVAQEAEVTPPEFVEISLNDEEEKSATAGQRLMQNLKRLPSRFKANSRYQSLETDRLPESWEEARRSEHFAVGRSASLPTSPSMRQKLFANLKR